MLWIYMSLFRFRYKKWSLQNNGNPLKGLSPYGSKLLIYFFWYISRHVEGTYFTQILIITPDTFLFIMSNNILTRLKELWLTPVISWCWRTYLRCTHQFQMTKKMSFFTKRFLAETCKRNSRVTFSFRLRFSDYHVSDLKNIACLNLISLPR